MALGQETRLGLAEAHGPSAAALHLAHQEEPEADDEEQGKRREDVGEDGAARVRILDGDVDALVGQVAGAVELQLVELGDDFAVAHLGGRLGAVERDLLDLAGVHRLHEVGIADRVRPLAGRGRGHHGDERNEKEENDANKRQIAHVHPRAFRCGLRPEKIRAIVAENEC
jgi:hypothetical protein